MNKTGIVIILLCFLAAIAAVLWERRKIRKTMEEIERMLDAAMTGSFSETNFDESQLSALETKFAHYLSAAEASSQNIAQEKDKIKTLIADISHQTKTPIANLLLYSELLMEETLPASAKANVEALHKQSEKLRFLIDSLVKLSRLENGILSLSPQPAALQPLLESVVEQYTAKASEKGLSLQMQDTDAFAVFDFKWTAEALANIVDNAIKYTEHVKNRKCIRKLSLKSLYANRRRNLIAIFAIALTTLLFTSMFTIVLSLNASYETYQFRQVGGYAHGTFKDVSPEQAERIAAHPKVKATGARKVIGITAEGVFAKIPAEISYIYRSSLPVSFRP